MFAIIKTGGKQYKVAEGDIFNVERIRNQESGIRNNEVIFDDVLLVVNPGKSQDDNGAGVEVRVGKPLVSGAKVTAKVLEEGKGKKKMVFRYKSKTRYKKKKGHRQPYTKVQIIRIETN